jgi:predicted metal-dependent HD superfamily phosphohydrolase
MDPLESWPLGQHTGLRDRLLAAYGDPARGYHDARHLVEVLDNIQLLREELPRPEMEIAVFPPPHQHAVLLAAWFHDAVYDSEGDLEERSAVLAETELAAAGCAEDLVAEVARLVRLTATHRPEPGDRRGAVLCDADLAILAADDNRYDEYVAGVRTEYARLDDATFRAGRAAVLAGLVRSGRLFHTETGRLLWEDRARTNVQRELAALTASSAATHPREPPR